MATNENGTSGGNGVTPGPGSPIVIGGLQIPTWSIVAEQLGKKLGAAGISAVAVFTMEPDPARGPESVKVAMHVFAVTEQLALRMRAALEPLLPVDANREEEPVEKVNISGAN